MAPRPRGGRGRQRRRRFSGGRSSAPYLATNEEVFTHFAVLHGGVFAGGLGTHPIRGWLSTGENDGVRPFSGVESAADSARRAGFVDLELHAFLGGHELRREEMRAVVGWWLGR